MFHIHIHTGDDMIAKLYSQLSDIRSAADQDRMALKMAEVRADVDCKKRHLLLPQYLKIVYTFQHL